MPNFGTFEAVDVFDLDRGFVVEISLFLGTHLVVVLCRLRRDRHLQCSALDGCLFEDGLVMGRRGQNRPLDGDCSVASLEVDPFGLFVGPGSGLGRLDRRGDDFRLAVDERRLLDGVCLARLVCDRDRLDRRLVGEVDGRLVADLSFTFDTHLAPVFDDTDRKRERPILVPGLDEFGLVTRCGCGECPLDGVGVPLRDDCNRIGIWPCTVAAYLCDRTLFDSASVAASLVAIVAVVADTAGESCGRESSRSEQYRPSCVSLHTRSVDPHI